jgi:hypothetical protein
VDLKKHGYWIAMGALAAVAGILYIVLVVSGVNAELKKKNAQLANALKDLKGFASKSDEKAADPLEGIPIPEMVKYWQDQQKALQEDVKKIEDKYRERDKNFKSYPHSDLATFVSTLRQNTENELAKPNKALFEQDFVKVIPITDPAPQQDAEIPFAQKKFYMGKELIEAAKAAHCKTIVEVKFKEPEKGDPKAGPRDLDRIEVEASLKMPATEVVKLVSHLLKSPLATFEVRDLSIEPASFTYPDLDPWKIFEMPQTPQGGPISGTAWKSFPGNVFIGLQDSADPKSKTRPAEIGDKLREPAVLVHLVLHALDFNFPEKTAK